MAPFTKKKGSREDIKGMDISKFVMTAATIGFSQNQNVWKPTNSAPSLLVQFSLAVEMIHVRMKGYFPRISPLIVFFWDNVFLFFGDGICERLSLALLKVNTLIEKKKKKKKKKKGK